MLFFDEYYDQTFYPFETALRVAAETRLLIVIGTEGTTTLPKHIVACVSSSGGTLIDVNLQETRFSHIALRSPMGLFLKGSASTVLPEIVTLMRRVDEDAP